MRDNGPRVYRRSIFAVAGNIIGYLFGIGLVFLICGFLFGTKAALAVAGVVSLLCIWDLMANIRVKVIVTESELIVCEKKKAAAFRLEDIRVSGKSVNNDDFELTVTEGNGRQQSFDISLLGASNFQRLLEDLKVVGENSEVIKLEAEKKK